MDAPPSGFAEGSIRIPLERIPPDYGERLRRVVTALAQRSGYRGWTEILDRLAPLASAEGQQRAWAFQIFCEWAVDTDEGGGWRYMLALYQCAADLPGVAPLCCAACGANFVNGCAYCKLPLFALPPLPGQHAPPAYPPDSTRAARPPANLQPADDAPPVYPPVRHQTVKLLPLPRPSPPRIRGYVEENPTSDHWTFSFELELNTFVIWKLETLGNGKQMQDASYSKQAFWTCKDGSHFDVETGQVKRVGSIQTGSVLPEYVPQFYDSGKGPIEGWVAYVVGTLASLDKKARKGLPLGWGKTVVTADQLGYKCSPSMNFGICLDDPRRRFVSLGVQTNFSVGLATLGCYAAHGLDPFADIVEKSPNDTPLDALPRKVRLKTARHLARCVASFPGRVDAEVLGFLWCTLYFVCMECAPSAYDAGSWKYRYDVLPRLSLYHLALDVLRLDQKNMALAMWGSAMGYVIDCLEEMEENWPKTEDFVDLRKKQGILTSGHCTLLDLCPRQFSPRADVNLIETLLFSALKDRRPRSGGLPYRGDNGMSKSDSDAAWEDVVTCPTRSKIVAVDRNLPEVVFENRSVGVVQVVQGDVFPVKELTAELLSLARQTEGVAHRDFPPLGRGAP